MKLISRNFHNGDNLPFEQVFNGLGYAGGNLSPHLSWTDVPKDTKSFVITCFDPMAPTGSGWWHWVVANIPATVNTLPAGAGLCSATLPAGAVHARNDYGSASYGGAAAPAGTPHGYEFTLYSLNTEHLEIGEDSSGAMVGFLVSKHKISEARITAMFP